MINQFFKELFCWHDYEQVPIQGKYHILKYPLYKCTKCGKISLLH